MSKTKVGTYQQVIIQFKQGLETNVNATATKNVAVEGEPHWTTDTDTLYVFDGTQNVPVATKIPIKTVSANYTATPEDGVILVDASTAAVTITLPSISGNQNKVLIIKKIDSSANSVTIAASGTETIDGANTVSLTTQYEVKRIIAGSSEWGVI